MVDTTTSREPGRPADGQAEPAAPAPGPRRGFRLLGRPAWSVGLLLLLVLLDLVVPVVHGRLVMHEVPTSHLDGSFQNVSGLLRLSEGQWPGKDFFPYLGIGPVLSMLPVFLLMGGTLTGSLFASHLLTLLSLQLVVGMTAALFFRRRPVWALVLGAAVPAVLVGAAMSWPRLWTDASQMLMLAALPGNSLRPVRAIAPYLLAFVTFFVLRPRWSLRRVAVVGAVAGVIAALWSNDYGLPSAGLLLVLLSAHALRWREAPLLRGLGVLWGSAGLGFLVSGLIATAGHLVPMLRYNFADVRGDQFWYFGAWDRDSRIFGVGDVVDALRLEGVLRPLLLLAVLLVWAALSRDLGRLLVPFIGVSTLAGGLLATFGGHAGGYFWSFTLWSWVAAAAALLRLVTYGLERIDVLRALPARVRAGTVLRAVGIAATIVALVLAGTSAVRANWAFGSFLASDPGRVHDEQLGGFLPVRFQDHVRQVTGRDDVLEEYMGLAGAINGPNTSIPVDSVIAALGSQRERFAQALEARPELVVTTAPDVAEWVGWNLSANWWFYRTLFQSYSPVVTSPMTMDWTPSEAATWDPVPCEVSDRQVVLDAPEDGLYEVALRYAGPGRSARAYSLVQNNINVAIGAAGTVALDPGAEEQRFPVAVHSAELGATVLGLSDVAKDSDPVTELRGCTASRVSVPSGADTLDLYHLTGPAPVGLTDANWDRGVSRTEAVFFVPYTTKDLADLQEAGSVRFSDGDTRTITRVERAGLYVHVHVQGELLDPEVAGAGHPFVLLP